MNPHIQQLTAKHDHLYPHPTQVWEQVNLVTLCENLKSVQGYQRVPMGQEYPLRQTTDYVMQSVWALKRVSKKGVHFQVKLCINACVVFL